MRRTVMAPAIVLTVGFCAAGIATSVEIPRPPVGACSSIALDNRGQYILGGNYDLPDPGMVFILKRGLVKTGFNPGTTGAYAEWTAKYASVVFSLLGYQHAWAGMNEAGLAFSTMRLEATENAPPDHRPPLGVGREVRPLRERAFGKPPGLVIEKRAGHIPGPEM